MSQTSLTASDADSPPGDPPPLSHCTRDGRRYVRRPEVRDEIRRVVAADSETWDVARLRNETLVHLVREFRSRAQTTSAFTAVVEQLGRRLARIVGDYSKGADELTRVELIDQIQNRVIILILEPIRCKKGEYLEVSFRAVVKGLTLNAVDSLFQHRRDHPVVRLIDDREDEDDHGPDPCVAVADKRLSPDEIVSLAETLDAITDSRHREAFVLRYAYDWPITAQNPDMPTLCKHFNKKERQIHNWLQTALDQMRLSTGEKS